MLDPDLRKYFNLGKRKFSSIVKKPGVRRGFKLSQYIHPTDSPEEVNQVLRRIAWNVVGPSRRAAPRAQLPPFVVLHLRRSQPSYGSRTYGASGTHRRGERQP